MYDLPYIPSERPLTRHVNLLYSCMRLMDSIEEEIAYVDSGYVMQLIESLEETKNFWETLRKCALEQGLEPDDELLQIADLDPYRFEYRLL